MVTIREIEIAQTRPFTLIAGPCQIESRDHAMFMAEALMKLCANAAIPLIFKASFDKANRSSHQGARGVGMPSGLKILEEISQSFDVPTITDVHDITQCEPVGEVVDALQIPAFLSRQTDLLQAAARFGKAVMVKKGQFLAPDDMAQVSKKISAAGNENILLCERGTSFGYHRLVNDFCGLKLMAETGYPVIFDATHSTQRPSGEGDHSGGNGEFAPLLARAALAVGVAGLFVEVHDDPKNAPSDGAVMMPLDGFEEHLHQWKEIDALIKSKQNL